MDHQEEEEVKLTTQEQTVFFCNTRNDYGCDVHTQAAPVLYLIDKYQHALHLSSVVENINKVRLTKSTKVSFVLHLHTCINMHMNKLMYCLVI